VGSGSGWAARYLDAADVIAIDLLDVRPSSAVAVRADMSRLPVRTGVVDGILFAASFHYGLIDEVVSEAARVLRPDGLMVVIDSPIYPDREAQARAVKRAATYYGKAGHPELADRYHPVESGSFKTALAESGFELGHFEIGLERRRLWHLRHRAPAAFVVARRLR
jgi:SAM-dependent methyltransferase